MKKNKYLINCRKCKNLTQEELARLVSKIEKRKCSQRMISNYEIGAYRISPKRARAIAIALELTALDTCTLKLLGM